MLKQKSILTLSLTTLALAAGVFLVMPKNTNVKTDYQHLFPNLYQQLNNVSTIIMRTHDSQFKIQNQEGAWILPEKADYPVEANKIKEVLLGMAELVPVEEKTSNPDFYERLHLQDVTQAQSQATQIELKDKDGHSLAALLIGKEQPAKAKPELSEIFVREPSKTKSWLTVGNLPTYNTPTDWVNKNILDLPEQSVVSLDLYHASTKQHLVLQKAPNATDFQIKDVPKGKIIDSQFSVNYIPNTLAKLTLENIYPLNNIDFSKVTEPTARLTTNTGVEIDMFSLEQEGKTLIKLNAIDNDKEQKNKSLVEGMNAKFSRWAFAIPLYQADEFKKTMADLVKDEKDTKEPKTKS